MMMWSLWMIGVKTNYVFVRETDLRKCIYWLHISPCQRRQISQWSDQASKHKQNKTSKNSLHDVTASGTYVSLSATHWETPVQHSNQKQHLEAWLTWRRLLCSDLTHIELFGHNDKKCVWRIECDAFNPKNPVVTVKCGGEYHAQDCVAGQNNEKGRWPQNSSRHHQIIS